MLAHSEILAIDDSYPSTAPFYSTYKSGVFAQEDRENLR